MTADDRDEELLRAAFADVRLEDCRQGSGPPFEVALKRPAPHRRHWRASPVLRLATAGVALVVAIATYDLVVERDSTLKVPSEVIALAAWRPATDVLLEMPNDLLRAAPMFGTSILDSVSVLDSLSTGAHR